jgi:hypothetical protein
MLETAIQREKPSGTGCLSLWFLSAAGFYLCQFRCCHGDGFF